jgi:hypothetical protein
MRSGSRRWRSAIDAMRGGSVAEKRRGLEDQLEVLGEAHVEHLVGLVERHHAQVGEVQRLAPQVVERTPRRRHHHVGAAPQGGHLAVELLAAVDRDHRGAELAPVPVERLGHLHRELARRHQHQRQRAPRRGPFARDALQDGERERRGLARAGRRLPQQVAPGEQRPDRRALDGRRLLVAERSELRHEVLSQPDVGERLVHRHKVGGRGAPCGGRRGSAFYGIRRTARRRHGARSRVRRGVPHSVGIQPATSGEPTEP